MHMFMPINMRMFFSVQIIIYSLLCQRRFSEYQQSYIYPHIDARVNLYDYKYIGVYVDAYAYVHAQSLSHWNYYVSCNNSL